MEKKSPTKEQSQRDKKEEKPMLYLKKITLSLGLTINPKKGCLKVNSKKIRYIDSKNAYNNLCMETKKIDRIVKKDSDSLFEVYFHDNEKVPWIIRYDINVDKNIHAELDVLVDFLVDVYSKPPSPYQPGAYKCVPACDSDDEEYQLYQDDDSLSSSN